MRKKILDIDRKWNSGLVTGEKEYKEVNIHYEKKTPKISTLLGGITGGAKFLTKFL